MTLLCIAALFVPTLSAQVAPAGAVIGNQATATYLDANSVSRTAFSNLVQTTVTQIYAGNLVAAQTKYASPGSQVLLPHTYTNSGNGPDSVTFSLSAVSTNFTTGTAHIYIDANGDGVPDNTTDLSGTAMPIAAGASIKVVVVATLAPGTGAGSQTLTLGSSAHSGALLLSNLDTVTEDNNAVVNVTKAISPISGQSGLYTVTLTYTNTGNSTATALAMIDDLVAQGPDFTYCKGSTTATCASGTGSATWNGVGFADGAAPGGLTWSIVAPAGGMTATVASIAPGVTGTVTYNVVLAVAPSTYPATYTNYAKYNYNDGTAVVPGAASYINTNTVALSFNGNAYVKFTAVNTGSKGTTGAYVAGTGTPPALNTTPDTDIIPTAIYSQGATIYWSQTLTNKGQLTDTYNLTLDTTGAGTTLDPTITAAKQFPAGTTFQLYRTDGATPLTDSNGDGIVDGGPVLANGTTVIVVAATLPAGTTVANGTQYIVNLIATSTNGSAANFATPGIQDVIQDEFTVTSMTKASVDVEATSVVSGIGSGIGASGESVAPAYTGNPGTTIAVPFWIFNTGTIGPDAYNLAFNYNGTSNVGLINPVTPFVGGAVPPAVGNISAWTVLIAPTTSATCATYGAPVTASSVIPASGSSEYCLLLQVPASYAANTYHFTIQAQSNSTGAIDQMAVQATVKTFDSVSINPNNQATVYAGGTVVYKHVVTNGGNVAETAISLTTPTMPATPAGWTVSAYYDATNVGTLTSAATSIVTPYTVPSLAPGASFTYFLVVQAPASSNPGDQQLTTWTLSLAGNSAAANTSVTDTSTVVNGQVKLVKSQWVDAPCTHASPAYSTANGSATSGQCVMYQIVATNTGTTNITNVTFADAAPPYTTYLSGSTPTVSNSCSMTNPSVSAWGLSVTAPFSYAFTGSMTPNCTATVVFEVKLN
jgi:uncharacterized repeat protein (TIGR01451 family)